MVGAGPRPPSCQLFPRRCLASGGGTVWQTDSRSRSFSPVDDSALGPVLKGTQGRTTLHRSFSIKERTHSLSGPIVERFMQHVVSKIWLNPFMHSFSNAREIKKYHHDIMIRLKFQWLLCFVGVKTPSILKEIFEMIRLPAAHLTIGYFAKWNAKQTLAKAPAAVMTIQIYCQLIQHQSTIISVTSWKYKCWTCYMVTFTLLFVKYLLFIIQL